MTPGHQLWIELNYGKYVQPDGPNPFDWWPELPEKRRQQYEEAALVMMAEGAKKAKCPT